MSAVLPANARCPRCGGPFRCGVGDTRCACFDLHISASLRAQLAREYTDCLCVACLACLAAQAGPAAVQDEQKQKQEP